MRVELVCLVELEIQRKRHGNYVRLKSPGLLDDLENTRACCAIHLEPTFPPGPKVLSFPEAVRRSSNLNDVVSRQPYSVMTGDC
jgi:hypothetical protein